MSGRDRTCVLCGGAISLWGGCLCDEVERFYVAAGDLALVRYHERVVRAARARVAAELALAGDVVAWPYAPDLGGEG